MTSLRRVKVPDSGSLLPSGEATPEMMGVLNDLGSFVDAVKFRFDGGYDDDRMLVVQFPEDGDYPIWRNTPYAFVVNAVTTKSAAGTCTATVKINGVALGGAANSVSTSEQTQTHSTANEVAAGDDVVVTISGNSGCENLELSVAYTRSAFK